MTNGELYHYVENQLKAFEISDIHDWRPASDFYIEDIAKIVKTENGKQFIVIPFGLRLLLNNGDSIIYIRKEEEK